MTQTASGVVQDGATEHASDTAAERIAAVIAIVGRIAVIGWLFGVGWQLVRLLGAHRSASAVVRTSAAPPTAVVRRLRELAKRLRIRRSVRLKIAAAGPWMFGWLRPVLVLPEWLVDPQTEPELLDAVLLHELTHIRRGDWLLTLLQRLIVAVFFFHPAVRWLSGRVEVEREAAVDACTAALLNDQGDGRLVIARSLLEAARRAELREPIAATASFASDRSSIEERLARLLHSARRTLPRSTPWTAALMVAGVLAGLAGLIAAGGSSSAVAESNVAADANREAVANAADDATDGAADGAAEESDERLAIEGPILIKANLIGPDGRPAPKGLLMYDRDGLSANAETSPDTDVLYVDSKLPKPGVWIMPRNLDGCSYKPLYTDRVEVLPQTKTVKWNRREYEVRAVVDFGTVQLEPRTPVTFKFLAAKPGLSTIGPLPVEGLQLDAVIANSGDGGGSFLSDNEIGGRSNERGEITLDIGEDVSLTVKVRHPGYAEVMWTGTTDSNEPIEIRLRPTTPVSGYVFGPDGRPVVDAAVSMCAREPRFSYEKSLPEMHNDPRDNGSRLYELARTDADGKFTLSSLHSQYRYEVMILKDGLRPTRVPNIVADGRLQLKLLSRIDMASPLIVKGYLTGDRSMLPSYRGEQYVQWRETLQFDGLTYGSLFKVPVSESGLFEIDAIIGPDADILVPSGNGGHSLRLQVMTAYPTLGIDLKQRDRQPGPKVAVSRRPATPLTVRGSLVDGAGQPLDGQLLPSRVALLAIGPNVPLDSYGRPLEQSPFSTQTHSITAKVDRETGEFSAEVRDRISSLVVVAGAKGHNITAMRLPFGDRFAATQDVVDGIEVGPVRLTQATPGQIRVVNAATGDPIEGVSIGGTKSQQTRLVVNRQQFALPQPSFSDWGDIATDADGIARVPFVAAANQELITWIRHPGYEERPSFRFRFESADGTPEAEWRLTPAPPVVGRVLDSAGQPLAGVEIRAASRTIREPNGRIMTWGSNWKGSLAESLAVTDADGRYELTSLIADARYELVAIDPSESDPLRPATISIPSGRTETYTAEPVRLQAGIVVQGRLTGPLDWLPQRDGGPTLEVRIDGDHDWSESVPVGDDGTFRIDRLLPGILTLRVPGNIRTLRIADESITAIELEIRAKAYTSEANVPPRAVKAEPVTVVVDVRKDGTLVLDGEEATSGELIEALEQAVAESQNPTVVIRADRDVKFQEVRSLIDYVEQSGPSDVKFALRTKP